MRTYSLPSTADLARCIDELAVRFDCFEVILAGIAKKFSQTKRNPIFLTWHEAADLVGISPQALKKRVQRERGKTDGMRLRTIRGCVNRQDFLAFLEAKQIKSRGEIVQEAIR